ncbi:MAG: hypothetical protein CL840_12595 [Crocinitomicaceae bacterium]|nr:hypothetical protein [Crocinitomicaceae bacterium]
MSEEQVNQLISAKLDNNYFEETLKDFEPKLSIGTLISSPLKYIFSRAIVSFLLLFGVMYFVSIRRNMASMRRVLLLFIKYFILWVGFVLMGLIFIFLNLGNPYLFPIFLFTVPALIALFVYRKRKIELQRTLIFIAAMNLLLLGSLI